MAEVKLAHWQDHDFLLFGQNGPLFTTSLKQAADYGAKLAARLKQGPEEIVWGWPR